MNMYIFSKGSFPYSSKQQEVPVAWHPPVQNIAIQPISGSCTIHATLQVKFCVKQLEQITGKMQTSHCEDTSEKNLESHSQDNWTNSSRICSFFLANILMCNAWSTCNFHETTDTFYLFLTSERKL